MDMFSDFTSRVRAAVIDALSATGRTDDMRLDAVVAEPPRDPSHGDVATNAALVLAKPLGMKPRDLATRIGLSLERDQDVDAVEVAGPGFINLRLSDAYWSGQLRRVLVEQEDYGVSNEGGGVRVNVEYVSANPTGPMHVGHTRGAIVGDVLANLLQATGHEVTREYLVNDAGAQIEVLARSVYLRYREALGQTIGDIPSGLYPGDYLKPLGKVLAGREGARLLEADESEWLPIVKQAAVDAMLELIRADLRSLGIQHDVFFSEQRLHGGRIASAIARLEEDDLVYLGRLERPKGQADDWEEREQLLFRASQFGDDADRPLVKSDGSYTYFAADIAYHFDKFERGFARMIDVLGADHGGYVKRVVAAVQAMTRGEGRLDVKLCQIVRLMRGGEPVKMSKRSGDFVTLRDIVDEVGRDATRFMMLFRKADAPLDFDFQTVTEQSKDNPVFYVQYAHARCCSVLRQAGEEAPEIAACVTDLGGADLSLLTDEGEKTLIRRLADYPRVVSQASRMGEPHRMAFYLHDLAAAFHAHWNRGKDAPHLRFIVSEKSALTESRLALVSAVAVVLRNGLALLGVGAPQEMR